MRGRILWSLAAGAVALAALVVFRGYHLAYAAIVAVAVGALVYAALGAADRLRDLYRK